MVCQAQLESYLTAELQEATLPNNRELVTQAFAAWSNGTGYVTSIFVVDGTAFYDSISFNELWATVSPATE